MSKATAAFFPKIDIKDLPNCPLDFVNPTKYEEPFSKIGASCERDEVSARMISMLVDAENWCHFERDPVFFSKLFL